MKLVESCKHCWAWNALNSNSWDFWVGASFVVWKGKKSSQESAGRNTSHNQIALVILSYILGISKRQAHPSERDIPGLRVSSHVTQCAFSPIHEIVLWPFAGLTIFMGKWSMLRTGSMPVVVGMQQSSGMRLGIPDPKRWQNIPGILDEYDICNIQVSGMALLVVFQAGAVAKLPTLPGESCRTPTFQQYTDISDTQNMHKTRCLQRSVVLLQAFAVIRPDSETGL